MAEENAVKSNLFLKIVLVIVTFFLFVGSFVLGMEYQKSQTPEKEVVIIPEDRSEVIEERDGTEIETEETVAYSGEVVSAQLPPGWTIVEYFDGDGSETLVQGVDYSGLTGLEILKEGDVVFSLKGVSGIGGISACSDLVVFSDTDNGYVNDITDEAALAGIATSTSSVPDEDYVEIEVLGRKIRRVERVYYWDMDTTSQSFDTNCGLDGSAFPFTGVSFYSDIGTATEDELTTYWYEVSETSPLSDLEVLDDILVSLIVL